MARAKRHYIPGHIWHITHRCHQREFLFKHIKDRYCWMQWLFEAKKRYGLKVLNYMVTSNHIHLLVYDGAGRDVIPRSIQLAAGRTGQEYNERKKRGGAFWQDRYHATAVENGDHLLRCIVYIDLNMVLAGVITHPSQWKGSGYNEIQNPRRKKVIINYNEFSELTGFETYARFQAAHSAWINHSLSVSRGECQRQKQWTESIAIGSEQFVIKTKEQLGFRAIGRRVLEVDDDYQLREEIVRYNALFEDKNNDIGVENYYYWNINCDFPNS